MVAFPKMMITLAGVMLLVILTLAGIRFFPAHANFAGGIGAAFGCIINMVLQRGLWSRR
jgi:hypothetical protein